MVSFTHTIRDIEGLHARPVAQIAAAARAWESTITVACRGVAVDARDLMGLMGLAARQGDEIEVSVAGADEDAAAAAMRRVCSF